ncbi:hypothetical protein ACJA3S_08775 [Pseudomonas sp. KnCO4]|uniref:hypothetical protein n=1 Tax=Pseudomonas sp. KnCO4 TaxID=3381355 RepID=UPI003877A5EF
MSIRSILFIFASSVVYSFFFWVFKELSPKHDWIYAVGVPFLIALTAISGNLKDKISEKDPSSKLFKAKAEIEESKTKITDLENRHKTEISKLKDNLALKDSLIHNIKSGINNNLIEHGETAEFFAYAKKLASEINSDIEANTLAPELTPKTKKYFDMAATQPTRK